MDFRDSPKEAEFRSRLRAWIAQNNPGLPVSSTDDEYWARQAEWHTALYDAGFFGLSWPARFGGPGDGGVKLPAGFFERADLRFRPAAEVARMCLDAVRDNRPLVVTDGTMRKLFRETYHDVVMKAFDELDAFDAGNA